MSGFRPRFFIPPVGRPFGAEPCARGSDAMGSRDTGSDAVELALTAEDSRHALRVLRLGEGDECEVVVGAAVYAATVSAAATPVRVRLVAHLEGAEAGPDYVTQVGLVQALARPALIDYVIEKGTEVGASFFLLVQAGGSPRRAKNAHSDRVLRWRRIAREAAKQSKQLAVPPVELAESIDQVLQDLDVAGTLSIVLEPGAVVGVEEVLRRRGARPGRVALWVGPEGGWSPVESERFSAAGAESARLGRSVLRTETAGPVAVAVARLTLGDW